MSPVTDTAPPQRTVARARQVLQRLNALGGLIPQDLVALAARVFPAVVFWLSARTKVEGVSIKEETFFLFEHVYALPLIPPVWAAVTVTLAEHILPVLLILGLMSRISALGLLIMTAVIQIFVFSAAWVTHGLWAVALLVILTHGPGRLSLDHLLGLDPRARQQ